MHVLVLSGGLSAERDVSLRSGRRAAEALLHVYGTDLFGDYRASWTGSPAGRFLAAHAGSIVSSTPTASTFVPAT